MNILSLKIDFVGVYYNKICFPVIFFCYFFNTLYTIKKVRFLFKIDGNRFHLIPRKFNKYFLYS